MTAPPVAAPPSLSVFASAVAVFDALTCDPDPLGLDCTRLDPRLGLPADVVALPRLREWLDRRPDQDAARARFGGNWSPAPVTVGRGGG